MYYLQRNPRGNLVRVDTQPFDGMTDESAETTLEITHWQNHQKALLAGLQKSDLELVRVLEDLIYVLTSKGILSITDLPVAAQNKLSNRNLLRQELDSLENLLNEDEILL